MKTRCCSSAARSCRASAPRSRRSPSRLSDGRPHRRSRDSLKDAGITVTGRVEDVRPHISESAVYVVPLRIGGGTRLKIFEAMAMGKAVVSTAIGRRRSSGSGRRTLIARRRASGVRERRGASCFEMPTAGAGWNQPPARWWSNNTTGRLSRDELDRALTRIAQGSLCCQAPVGRSRGRSVSRLAAEDFRPGVDRWPDTRPVGSRCSAGPCHERRNSRAAYAAQPVCVHC